MTATKTVNTYGVVARALADDVIEILENDRDVYDAITGRLAPLFGDLPGDNTGRFAETLRELVSRMYRDHGVDPEREATVVESLTVRLLGLVDWRVAAEYFLSKSRAAGRIG